MTPNPSKNGHNPVLGCCKGKPGVVLRSIICKYHPAPAGGVLPGCERVAEVTDVVVVKALLLRPVAAKDGGGLDLTTFLDGLLFDQLIPQAINKVFGRVGAKAVGQILAGVAVRSAEWAKGLGRDAQWTMRQMLGDLAEGDRFGEGRGAKV